MELGITELGCPRDVMQLDGVRLIWDAVEREIGEKPAEAVDAAVELPLRRVINYNVEFEIGSELVNELSRLRLEELERAEQD